MTVFKQASKLKNLAYLFIAKKQNKNGGFISHTTTHGVKQEHTTIFYPALIGTVLSEIYDTQHDEIFLKIIESLNNFWLLQPTVAHSSWYTYWSILDSNYSRFTYPPDLDDSSLVLASKHCLNPNTHFSDANADFIVTLTSQEQKPGGPYRTWVGCEPVSPWNDYDPVVNSNIHYLLKKWNVQLPTLAEYLMHTIKNNTWRSPYYTSDYLSLYLIIRSLDLTNDSEISTYVHEIIKAHPPKLTLELACAIIILNRIKIAIPSELEKRFLATTIENFEPNPCIREHGSDISGCDALTAALVALAASQLELTGRNATEVIDESHIEIEKRIHDSAVSVVAKKLHSLEQTLFESSLPKFCALVKTAIAHEVTLLSYDIGSSLDAQISEEVYTLLGSANLFGWLAFQWYDECYDEKIISSSLSLANICLREATNSYLQVARILSVSSKLVLETLDQVDKAHAYELTSNQDIQQHLQTGKKITYLPNLTPSERSIGHCLGPLLIIQSLQIPKKQYHQFRCLFNHYLNTRQICDDLHDWYEDFKAKRLTSVTRYLFMTSNLFPQAALHQTHKIFWREGLKQALTNVKYELQQANNCIKAINWLKHKPHRLVKTLQRLNQAIAQAEIERETSRALLNHYETSYEPFYRVPTTDFQIHS